MDNDLFNDFARAVVAIVFEQGVQVLEPRPSGDVGTEFPLGAPVHIVTAYNPRGLASDEAANVEYHHALLADVKALGVMSIPTVGSARDGSMEEPGLLLVGLDRPAALSLGRKYSQSAIYEWQSDRLTLLGALDTGVAVLGWRLEKLETPPEARKAHPSATRP